MKPWRELFSSFDFIWVLLVLVVGPSSNVHANADKTPEGFGQQWQNLIDSKKYQEADKLCEPVLLSADKMMAAEAHKCMANVELASATYVNIEGTKDGGGYIGTGYTGPGVDKALAHLDAAIRLSPGDISIHQGRLHLLEQANRFDAMLKALENSIQLYPGKDGLEHWLDYAAELNVKGEYSVGLAYSKMLEAHYPNDARVIANVGAFLSLLKRDEEALTYTQRAVEMDPNDAMNNWNLGRLYFYMKKMDLANTYYEKAIHLEKDKGEQAHYYCLYADFLKDDRGQPARAEDLKRKYCPHEK